MAYDKEELETAALEAIEKDTLVFIHEVCFYMECSEATFFNHKLNELESIKSALGKNKVDIKRDIREQWKAGNPTEKVALYKILGNEDERSALNGNNQNNQVSGEMKLIIERKTITGRE